MVVKTDETRDGLLHWIRKKRDLSSDLLDAASSVGVGGSYLKYVSMSIPLHFFIRID